MKKIIILLLLLFVLNFTATVYAVEVDEASIVEKRYKNIILFIGDGMGPNHVDAGGIYLGEDLCFDVVNEKWSYHAYSNTDSLTSQGFTLDESKSLLRPEENK